MLAMCTPLSVANTHVGVRHLTPITEQVEHVFQNIVDVGQISEMSLVTGLLIECAHGGWTYVGNATSHSKGAKRYYQYRCGTRLRTHDPR